MSTEEERDDVALAWGLDLSPTSVSKEQQVQCPCRARALYFTIDGFDSKFVCERWPRCMWEEKHGLIARTNKDSRRADRRAKMKDEHVHDKGKCCECGSEEHCWCECPVFREPEDDETSR